MGKYILKRIGYILLSLYLIITATFVLMRLAPGSPFASERRIPPALEQQMNEAYGLNDPIHKQYIEYVVNAFTFDFGPSFKFVGQEVTDIIFRSFPYSLVLGLEAMFIALGIGVLLGVIAAIRHNKFSDYIAMVIAVLGISVPSFIMASILQYVFAIKLEMFSVARMESFADTILPAVALATTPLAFIARLMRSSMLDVLNSDYIKTAKSKGMSQRVVTYKHGLRNAMLPVISYMGPLIASILTGSFIIETIFGIPGLGSEFVTSITNRDYTVIMGTTVFFGILLLFSVLIVDLIYGLIDPRIKLTAKGGEK
ncbi:ABC transporter permease [Ornithinibacillus bavariensis]|uniref:Oligopeptide transport system permease protein OppB n=1 Tax=Ornithinibacillus bavariensis TaxID=545502 RepID=A0A919X740_9BACI|nr:ABC transporter permease [Ornithinibacillus bavariensis]GIO26746.1 oligopeptide transport system permease protein OppB [Ornithinibacillus bavariensis]HAM80805.1 peptide ABC transporter permease [Ornithinibacillus sp.]